AALASQLQDARAEAPKEHAVVRHEDHRAFEIFAASPWWPGPDDWSARRVPESSADCRASALSRTAISRRRRAPGSVCRHLLPRTGTRPRAYEASRCHLEGSRIEAVP